MSTTDIAAGARCGVKGRYKMQVLRADGSIKEETPWFDNVITNRGLDYLHSGPGELNSRPNNLVTRCTVGTGSAVPAITDTNLSGPILGTVVVAANAVGTWITTTETFIRSTMTYTFAVGAVVGNVSEVGVGPGNFVTSPPYDDLFSRALVLDGGMMPTTITVLVDEQLRVFYTYEVYPDMAADDSYVVNISGTNYTIALRPANLGTVNSDRGTGVLNFSTGGSFDDAFQATSSGVLAAKTTRPPSTGGNYISNSVTPNAYVLGDHTRTVTANMTTADANFAGGIGSCTFGNFWGKWQMTFTPKIPKTNLQTLSLTFRITTVRI